MSGTANPLISVPELAAALAGDAPPAVLDVRWYLTGPPGIDSYRRGHVPGAVFVDLDTQLAGPPGDGGRHPLPDPADFEAAMRAAGVRADQLVVVCDDGDGTIAARAWWLLRYYGHASVRVLDGGFRAWAAAGQPVSTEDAHALPGDFSASPGHMPVLDAAQAAAVARSGVLLDARAPARYRGETEPVDRVAGHIPGALSAPTAENVTGAGRVQIAGRAPGQVRGARRAVRRRGGRGRGLLRVRGHRGARGARAGTRGRDRGAVRRLLVGLARRSGAAGCYWPAAGHDGLDRLNRKGADP